MAPTAGPLLAKDVEIVANSSATAIATSSTRRGARYRSWV